MGPIGPLLTNKMLSSCIDSKFVIIFGVWDNVFCVIYRHAPKWVWQWNDIYKNTYW